MNVADINMSADADKFVNIKAPHTSTWNVIDEGQFKDRLKFVFDKVAKCLSNTLGPYGSTTIIEKYGEMHVTKDGWNVLKNIRFNDPVDNNIMALLVRISAQVVIQVGDGSTSSIVAANEILKLFNENEETLSKYRPRDLMDKLNLIVNNIVERIYKNAIKIDHDNFDEIYRIATIATNDDTVIPEMIKTIYEKTGNATIEYRESKTNETSFEIVDGYILNNASYLDTIFVTNDDGTCVVNKPYILMFDYKIDTEHSLRLISKAAEYARDRNSRLVVIAPHYDRILLDYIRRNINLEYRDKGTSQCIYCRASLINNMSNVLYNDFATMAGGTIMHEQYDDDIKTNELDNIEEYIGHVDKMIIADNTTMISGFVNRNENLYKKCMDDAVAKFNTIEEDYRNRGIVDTAVTEAKNRVTKLKGNMGIINVGGASTLERKANFDLVEDAVKACESAFNYGYNIGGGLIIPYTIGDILNECDMDDSTRNLYMIIRDAFLNVFTNILMNKYGNIESAEPITDSIRKNITERLSNKWGYDLITDEFTNDIINSCRTDIEILRGAISVISLIYTSNQYLSIVNTEQK